MVCVVIVAYSWPGPLGRGGLLERRVFFYVNARLCHSYSYSRHLTPFGPHFTATLPLRCNANANMQRA